MNKAYNKITWQNKPSTATPLNQTNLNEMSNALDTIDDRVIALDSGKVGSVTVTNTLQTGDTIATITVDGTVTNIKSAQVEVDAEPSATSENPLQNKAIYEMLNNLLPEETVQGNPISINDASGLNAKACSVDLLPIQDLHGQSAPYVGGAGKNKLQVKMASSTSQGITATVYDDGTVLVNGTATGLCTFTLNNTLALSGNYILSGCPSGGSSSTFRMDCYWAGQGALIDSGNGVAISPNGNAITIRIVVMQGVTVNNQLFKPMIRLATETDPTFAPYKNICPISGRTEVNLTVADAETSPTQTETYTETLGQTVYGGKVDFVSGKLTIDTKYNLFNGTELGWSTRTGGAGQIYEITLPESITQSDTQVGKCNELTWNNYLTTEYSYRIRNTTLAVVVPSSFSTVADFTTWLSTHNLQITYPLNTPIEITLTPEEISLLKGTNVISTDGDNINLVYSADIKAWVENQLQS